MATEELARLMEQIEEKDIPWETVEEKIKVPRTLLDLYARSGPVPVRIISGLKQLLEEPA